MGLRGISLSTIHSISSILFTVIYNVQVNVKKLPVSKSAYPTISMSQEQQITPVPGPTVYEDEQEMLNGNGGSAMVPPPQPSVPNIQGVQREGQVEGVMEEPAEVGAPNAAKFQGPRIFVHAPRYEWHPEVHVQGLDEEAR